MLHERIISGDAFYADERYNDALMAYYDALFLTEPDADLFVKIARCNHRLGDTENALEYYIKALEDCPGHFGALMEAGDCCIFMQKPANAIPYFQQIIDLLPGSELSKTAIEKIDEAQKLIEGSVGSQATKTDDSLEESGLSHLDIKDKGAANELNQIMLGKPFVNTGYVTVLIQKACGIVINGWDTVIESNGKIRFIAYTEDIDYDIRLSPDETSVDISPIS